MSIKLARSVASYAQEKEYAARSRGGDDLVLALLKTHLEHPVSLPPSLLRDSVTTQITREQWTEAREKLTLKKTELDRRLNGPSNYKARFWGAISNLVLSPLREKTYTFIGEEVREATRSLDNKSEQGTWLRGESGGERKNRYGRLLDCYSNQIRCQQPEDNEVINDRRYNIVLAGLEKRRLRRALRHTQTHQATTSHYEWIHQKRSYIKEKGIAASEAKANEIEAGASEEAQQRARLASCVLFRLGYIPPDSAGLFFGLK